MTRVSITPYPIAIRVGSRIKKLRKNCLLTNSYGKLKPMTQKQLADKLGVTFQQVQKYEWGQNVISAFKLYELSSIFNVPMESFFNVDHKSNI